MTSPKRAKELRDILASYGDVWTFTESQEAPAGELLADEDVDHDLREIVAEMRDQYVFESGFDDATLAVIVRRFYAGDDDERLAELLDCSPEAVQAARFDVHLFLPAEPAENEAAHESMREASRVGHRWNDEFESVLSAAGYPTSSTWSPLEDVLASTDEGENVASAN